MKESYLSSNNLSIGYKARRGSTERVLYSNLNFNLYSGELTCLLGANGTGKSTLLKTINSSLAPLSGEVMLFDKNIKSYSENELSKNLGLVLTEKINAGGLLVKEIVSLGRYPYTGFWGKNTKHDDLIVQKSMTAVGISHKANCYISELSDGERQKAMIAKALAQECPIILLDEPTAFLDATSRIETMSLLQQLAKDQNKAILLSTHDIELASSMADRLWLLSDKKGMKCGLTEDIILSNDINTYLGQKDIQFDQESGCFVSLKNYQKFISVEAEPNLMKWTKNLLIRNNYSIADADTLEDLIVYSLKINSPSDLYIQEARSKKEYNLNSFNELSDLLQD